MKKNIVKNTSYLYIMNIVKMIFPLIILPYLTRVLSVESYGVVAYNKAIMQYMQLFVDFGFILSGTRDIVMVKDNKESLKFEIGNIFVAKMILSGFATIIIIVMAFSLPILRENLLFTFLSFLPVLLSSFLFEYVFRGLEHMEAVAIPFIVMKTVSTLLTFVFVKSDFEMILIPILDVIGSLFAVCSIIFIMKKMKISFKIGEISEVLKKLKDSAVYFFSNMATTAFSALNTLLIGIYIEATDVAYWSLCMQMVGAAQALFTPVTDGIYPQMIKTREMSLIKRTLKLFLPVVTVGCIFTIVVAKYALLILGGNKYIVATSLLRVLTISLFFSFPSMLFGWPTLGAIGKEKEATNTTVIAAIFQVVGLILLIVLDKFTVINIALLRGATEFLLFIIRYYITKKYKDLFN